MRTVYVIGAPGSGKSTAVAAALSLLEWGSGTAVERPVPHVDYGAGRIQIGRVRPGGFAGTDGLGMAINPRAIEFVGTRPAEILVGEGDRLANDRFFAACAEAGSLEIVWLDVPPEEARARALSRAAALGIEPQSESWRTGRVTKVSRLAGGWPHVRIDGRDSPADVARRLADVIGEI